MTVTPAFPLRAFTHAAVDFPFRRRMLLQWFYRAGLEFGDHLKFFSAHTTIGPDTLVTLLLAFASTMLLILSAKLFISRILGPDSPFVWFSLLTLYITNYHQLLVHEMRFMAPYDVPSAALFGLACYAAFSRNRWLYYPVFLIATFNRESTVFLPLVFLIFGLRKDLPLPEALRRFKPAAYLEVVLQLVAWRAILTFEEHITGGVVHQDSLVIRNLHMLANPFHWSTYVSIFGFLWIPFLIFFNRISDIGLRRCALLAPLWAAVMVRYADMLEIRTNSEWTVYLTVSLALIADASWKVKTPTQGSLTYKPSLKTQGVASTLPPAEMRY